MYNTIPLANLVPSISIQEKINKILYMDIMKYMYIWNYCFSFIEKLKINFIVQVMNTNYSS